MPHSVGVSRTATPSRVTARCSRTRPWPVRFRNRRRGDASGSRRATDSESNPAGRIQGTRKMLTAAAVIMSSFLVTSTVVLIPGNEFIPGGEANGRALAYLAHQYLGDGFGTLYDMSTIAILWFAGASAMAGLLNLVPRYLPPTGWRPTGPRQSAPCCWSSPSRVSWLPGCLMPTSMPRAAPSGPGCMWADSVRRRRYARDWRQPDRDGRGTRGELRSCIIIVRLRKDPSTLFRLSPCQERIWFQKEQPAQAIDLIWRRLLCGPGMGTIKACDVAEGSACSSPHASCFPLSPRAVALTVAAPVKSGRSRPCHPQSLPRASVLVWSGYARSQGSFQPIQQNQLSQPPVLRPHPVASQALFH